VITHSRQVVTLVSFVLASLAAGACAKAPETAVLTPPVSSVSPVATAPATASVKADGPPEAPAHAKVLGENDPLEAGLVTFEGMARPAKGGLDVRGVVLDEVDVKPRLASPVADAETLLGARVRVTASLIEHDDAPSRSPRGERVQERSGHFFRAKQIVAVTVVAEAQVLEGTLGRSKGFFMLEGKLVDHHDLDRALLPKPAASGEHVKLYGQARTVVCDPRAQCLIEGSLPLFDIARAERLP
jgi:hypothetical protein